MAKKKRRATRRRAPHRVVPLERSVKKSDEMYKVGHYAFFAGLLLAIVAGLFTNLISDVFLISALVFLGFIVGLLNVTTKETTQFLVAAVALMLAGVVNLGLIPYVGVYIRAILTNLVVFVVPAAVLVSLRAVWVLAKEK